MSPLSGLDTFLAVAEAGSLRRAAARLGVQPPAVSYQLKALEERIGASLFLRTTRSVTLTDAGRSLLARARPAMTELEGAIEDARSTSRTHKGKLKITLTHEPYRMVILPRLKEFHEQYPDIELELSFDEGFVDLAERGFHAGVRLGGHIREDMIAVRISPPFREAMFGAPSYLDTHGRPQAPADLLKHNCVYYRYIASNRHAQWRVMEDGAITSVDVRGNLTVNSTAALLDAARSGHGLAWLFRHSVEEDVRQGRLEVVLQDYAVEWPGYFLYYPKANASLQMLRDFVEHMRLGATGS
ncbi:MAG: LysR substrate-binding domain-containing protein [Pseudomonadota bacterium]